jgi:polyisoprenyl-phosphate glycosyltransferase
MISAVIPALNEERALGQTIAALAATLAAAKLEPFEIVVVDDGSTDNTRSIALQAGARVVSHPHNLGYGRSLKDGIQAATYDTIVITDADGTYPVETIPELVSLYRRGFDMVVGQRHGPHYRQSSFKMPMRRLLRFLVEWTAARRVPDINSGLRIFSKSSVVQYFPHLCDTFSFTTSLTLSYMMTSRFVAYHKIDYYERIGTSKVRLLRDSLLTLQYIIEAIVYYNPLKIFLLFSLICALGGILLVVMAVSLQIVTLIWLGVGTSLVAIIVLCIGLLAVQLKQIMESPRRSPRSDDADVEVHPKAQHKPIERSLNTAHEGGVRSSRP